MNAKNTGRRDSGRSRALRRKRTDGNSVRNKESELLRSTLLGDAELREKFGPYPNPLDVVCDDSEAEPIFLRLVSEGCGPGFLLGLLMAYIYDDEISSWQKKELDSVKSRFTGVIRRLKSLQVDIASLSRIQLQNTPLLHSLAFDSIDARLEKEFARRYMSTELPGSLLVAKAFFKELKHNVALENSVRDGSVSRMLAWLYTYCCAATRRPVGFREIAALANAGFVARGSDRSVSEATVRMELQRYKRSGPALSHENLELLMSDYVRSYTANRTTFDDWFSSNGSNWLASHVKALSPGKILSGTEYRFLKLSERQRLKK
jgi:hypothetical protein